MRPPGAGHSGPEGALEPLSHKPRVVSSEEGWSYDVTTGRSIPYTSPQ